MNYLALVVDDDENILQIYEHVLIREEFEVIKARNGEQAIAILQEKIPDVIFLDMLMPGSNGKVVLDYIRSTPHLHNTRVVVVSAHNQFAQDIDKSQIPFHEFYLKPIRPAQIREAARRTIDLLTGLTL